MLTRSEFIDELVKNSKNLKLFPQQALHLRIISN